MSDDTRPTQEQMDEMYLRFRRWARVGGGWLSPHSGIAPKPTADAAKAQHAVDAPVLLMVLNRILDENGGDAEMLCAIVGQCALAFCRDVSADKAVLTGMATAAQEGAMAALADPAKRATVREWLRAVRQLIAAIEAE